MIEKGFLRNQPGNQGKHQRIASIVSKTLLYFGTIVLITSFAYLFFNTDKSGAMVGLMMPFMVAGLGLIFVSYLIKRAYTKLRR